MILRSRFRLHWLSLGVDFADRAAKAWSESQTPAYIYLRPMGTLQAEEAGRGHRGGAVFCKRGALRQKAERTNRFNRLIAVFGVYLAENAMHVILDGLLGKVQGAGDLLVGQSFSDE